VGDGDAGQPLVPAVPIKVKSPFQELLGGGSGKGAMTFVCLCQQDPIPGVEDLPESLGGSAVPERHGSCFPEPLNVTRHLLPGQAGHLLDIPKHDALLLAPQTLVPEAPEGPPNEQIPVFFQYLEPHLPCPFQKRFHLRQRFELRVVHIDHHASYHDRSALFQTHTILEETTGSAQAINFGMMDCI